MLARDALALSTWSRTVQAATASCSAPSGRALGQRLIRTGVPARPYLIALSTRLWNQLRQLVRIADGRRQV